MSHDTDGVLTPAALLEHWQGHRRLTRRVIAAFPEEHFASYHAPGMRTFGEMTLEVLNVLEPNLRGILTGEWTWRDRYTATEKQSVLAAWDDAGEMLKAYWARIPAERLLAVEPGHFYGGPPEANLSRVFYFIDNEVHHRAQAYVYLRLLGVEPPAFYER
jgi:uncharacterized damage-inducible protein DinB